MSTVCIIGAGETGGATAHALARGALARRVLLVDDAAGVAMGKALDIQQAGAIDGFHTRLEGTADLATAASAAVCVIADRSGKAQGEWQGEAGLALLTRLARQIGEAPLVFAGASHAALMLAGSREARFPRERLVGSSPEALKAAVRSMVAMEAGCSSSDVALTVLGAPPSGFVVPWSQASIGGCAIERVLSQVQLSRIDARVAPLWPPGPQALGQAASIVVEALLSPSRRTFSVLALLAGEFGTRGQVGVVPAALASRGIVSTRTPELNTRERVRVENALGL